MACARTSRKAPWHLATSALALATAASCAGERRDRTRRRAPWPRLGRALAPAGKAPDAHRREGSSPATGALAPGDGHARRDRRGLLSVATRVLALSALRPLRRISSPLRGSTRRALFL